jgi:hypothetical protein
MLKSGTRILLICCLAVLAACNKRERIEPVEKVISSNEVAVIKTSEGDMVVQFWDDAAPNTIENFKKLARRIL